MAIYQNFRGGRADGKVKYPNKRGPENPTPWAFFYSYSLDSLGSDEPPPQASLYKFDGTIAVEGEDTIWNYTFFDYVTPADAIRWMKDHVSQNDEEW